MTDALRDSSLPILAVTAVCGALLLAANASLETRSEQPMTIAVSATSEDAPPDLSSAEIRSRARTAAERLEAFRSGRAAYRDGRYEAAETHLRRAAEQRPDNPMIGNYRGLTARELGQDEIAVRRWQDILERYPMYEAAHLNLGVLFAQQGQPDRAKDHYEQALASNPHYARAHYNLGLLYRQTDRREASLHHLTRAYELSSGVLKAKASYHRGRALLRTERAEAAREAFQEAIDLQPDHVEARLALADALPADPTHRDQKRRLYRQVARLDPERTVVPQNLADRSGTRRSPQQEPPLSPGLFSPEPSSIPESPEGQAESAMFLGPTVE